MNDPRISNPCFTTEEWLDAVESGEVFDTTDAEEVA